jgi:hypothetical protein
MVYILYLGDMEVSLAAVVIANFQSALKNWQAIPIGDSAELIRTIGNDSKALLQNICLTHPAGSSDFLNKKVWLGGF